MLARYEVNAGYSGIGVYWSPGSDDGWVSYYEIRRDGVVLGKTVKGEYYFDHAEGWSPRARYDVCTVDAHDNRSAWTAAVPCRSEPITAWSLGSHFAVAGREGWKAETSDDGKTFSPMNWVPAARNPGGDLGGTPNQPGGVEGYWEGKGGARVGRGWQQASTDTACVRTWVAPQGGRIHVVRRAMKEWFRQNLGTVQRSKIMLNDRVVWPANGDWGAVSLGDLYGDARPPTQYCKPLRFNSSKFARVGPANLDCGNDRLAWGTTFPVGHDARTSSSNTPEVVQVVGLRKGRDFIVFQIARQRPLSWLQIGYMNMSAGPSCMELPSNPSLASGTLLRMFFA